MTTLSLHKHSISFQFQLAMAVNSAKYWQDEPATMQQEWTNSAILADIRFKASRNNKGSKHAGRTWKQRLQFAVCCQPNSAHDTFWAERIN